MHTCRGQNDYGKEIKQMLKVSLSLFGITKAYAFDFSGDALHYKKDERQGRRGCGHQWLEICCHGHWQVIQADKFYRVNQCFQIFCPPDFVCLASLSTQSSQHSYFSHLRLTLWSPKEVVLQKFNPNFQNNTINWVQGQSSTQTGSPTDFWKSLTWGVDWGPD